MRKLRGIRLAALALLLVPWAPAQAGVRIGLGITLPLTFYGGYPYYAPYYAPYPVYTAPVVYPAAPVYAAAPAYQPVYAAASAPAPAAAGAGTTCACAPAPAPDLSAPAQGSGLTSVGVRLGEADADLQQLNSGDERGRAEAAVQLGRLRAGSAVDPLSRILEQDRSPAVREAAARGLGLIGAPSSLAALERAALADDDAEVRHSARFAAEVIRSHHAQR